MGARLGDLLRERFGQHPQVADIRGRGLFQALELVSNRDTLAGFAKRGWPHACAWRPWMRA